MISQWLKALQANKSYILHVEMIADLRSEHWENPVDSGCIYLPD